LRRNFVKNMSLVYVVAAAALAAAGCAHKQPPPPAPEVKAEPTPEPAASLPEPVKEAEQPPTCIADRDCRDGSLCLNGRCATITADMPECTSLRVHFDFDSTLLHSEDRPRLERIARCLRAAQAMRVTIEGNADERGTEEYNLQLGHKRAAEVERYLVALGASAAQLKTISYGFEKPICSEHNEDCWSKNRRAAVLPDGPAESR
jgi:peptidoglycan-associated lipoprotein